LCVEIQSKLVLTVNPASGFVSTGYNPGELVRINNASLSWIDPTGRVQCCQSTTRTYSKHTALDKNGTLEQCCVARSSCGTTACISVAQQICVDATRLSLRALPGGCCTTSKVAPPPHHFTFIHALWWTLTLDCSPRNIGSGGFYMLVHSSLLPPDSTASDMSKSNPKTLARNSISNQSNEKTHTNHHTLEYLAFYFVFRRYGICDN